MRIDLNSDLGESFGAWPMGQDAALMPVISSANVACGFHAGDPGMMRETVALARTHGVAVGAHPGFPDLVGFGRRELRCSAARGRGLRGLPGRRPGRHRRGAGRAAAARQGPRRALQHGLRATRRWPRPSPAPSRPVDLDPHPVRPARLGVCSTQAARRPARSPPKSFADRAYLADGSARRRARVPAASSTTRSAVVSRAVRMAQERSVVDDRRHAVPLEADTLCVHGDTPGAAALARGHPPGARGRAAMPDLNRCGPATKV